MATIMYQQALCIALENIINKALELNCVDTTVTLEKITQKTLSIHLTEIGFPLSFTINDQAINDQSSLDIPKTIQKIVLVTTLTECADCSLHTSIKTLIAIKKEQASLTELIKQDKLDVKGDLKIAQQFAHIAENLTVDWQSELAKHIGDVATHKLIQFGRIFKQKLSFAKEQIQADASEYIVHEQRLVVTNSQISHFNLQVDTLTEQTHAVSARLEQLIERFSRSAVIK